MGFIGALVQIRGDWAEYAHSFGLPTWSDSRHPCFFCKGSLENCIGLLREASPAGLPWMLKAESDYDEACAARAHHKVLTREQWASVTATLYYDKRDAGSRGRALMYDLPDLELQRDDSLEPSPRLMDVGDFELATEFPLPVVFWRRSAETGTKHRSPLLDPTLGISFLLFMVDTLHTLALGVYKNFADHAFWACLDAPIYDVVGIYGAGERNQIVTQRSRHELWEY